MKRGSVVIAFAVMWTAYTVIFTGYSWLRGYDISFGEIVSPLHWYSGPWPPPKASPNEIIPGGRKGGSSGSGTASG